MFKLTVKSIRANAARFVLTAVAVVLGVAFMAGTLVLTATIRQSTDRITANVYRSTDAVVRSHRTVTSKEGGMDMSVRGTVTDSVLAAVRHTSGVAAAEPEITGSAVIEARNGRLLDANPNRAVPLAFAWHTTPALNPMRLVAGHAPMHDNDVVIDRGSFRKGHYAVGETVHVLSQIGVAPYRLTGVVTYGGADTGPGGAQLVAFAAQTAPRVLGTPGQYAAIDVVAAHGVSQSQVSPTSVARCTTAVSR